MASLSLRHITKIYDDGKKRRRKKGYVPPKPAVNDFSMEIDDKEFIVFVGPSGCGKSTTLRMIAGLEDITDGELYIDGKLVNDIDPKDRDIAMVFQNYALYPHMTVYDNMAFGLKLRKMPKDEIDRKVHEAAAILGIEEYLNRKPKALSGGQRQRVALGRAMVRNPKVFLLDEPLSNLDAKLRASMRTEIIKLHDRLQTTFIYVTHDQVEAMTMGTRIVVMKDGIIQQIGTPKELYSHPCNLFVAGFIGTPQMNFFDGFVCDGKLHLADDSKADGGEDAGGTEVRKVVVGVRPEALAIGGSGEYSVDCNVDVVEELGSESLVYCSLLSSQTAADDKKIVAKTGGGCNLQRGDKIKFTFDIGDIHIFDAETTLASDLTGNKYEVD